MRRRATMAALTAAAAIPLFCVDDEHVEHLRDIPAFDATFVQIGNEQRSFDEARWRDELAMLDALGVRFIILQFSGGEHGSYDGPQRTPVAALLAAAQTFDMQVLLGLHDDPDWPSDAATGRMAPPLGDPHATRALAQLCATSAACAGWYIPQEIDDVTWAGDEATARLREHVSRTAQTLRELAPAKLIALAPFFTGTLSPAEYAQWWLDVLEPGTIDILILQDGVGTGRATPEVAGQYLAELGAALDGTGVQLWSVVELFRQLHGSPVDAEPFEAVPIDPATLRHSLAIETPLVERVVAFAVLDYMDPRRGGAARRLFQDYATRCRVARSSRRTPC